MFIKEYGGINSPFTKLLRNNGFKWSKEVEKTFIKFKKVVVNLQVLSLPNFTILFEIECDASRKIMGALLMQNKYLIAFYSQALKGIALGMST